MILIRICVFQDRLECLTQGRSGLFRGGGVYLLGVQLLACLVIVTWTSILSITLLKVNSDNGGLSRPGCCSHDEGSRIHRNALLQSICKCALISELFK